ncbi:MAG: helix-turn-helix domain-containing protein [Thermoanaerobaculia bacterium]
MNLDLRQQDLEDVARLWREMEELRTEVPERRIAHLLEGVCRLLGADDACWVSAVRGPAGGCGGWAVQRIHSRFPTEARRVLAKQGLAQMDRGEPDPVTRLWARMAGRSRAARRDELVPESEWRRDAFLDASARVLRIHDRLQGASSASPTRELTLLADRRERGRRFLRRQRDLFHLFLSGFEREAGALMEAADPAPGRFSVRGGAPRPELHALGSALETAESALRWRAVDVIIRACADCAFRTEDLARALGMSRSSLERFVKTAWGISPGMLIRRIRLDMAAEMLASSEASIAAVALCCGYGGAAQFARAFREQFHVSPTEWRRRVAS